MPESDIYLLQEVQRYEDIHWISQKLGGDTDTFDFRFDQVSHLGIISRFRIIESDNNTDKTALSALVEISEEISLEIVSIHLPYFWKPRNSNGQAVIGPLYAAFRLIRETFIPNGRSRSIKNILIWMKNRGSREYSILGGDFNTTPMTLAPRMMSPEFIDSLKGSGDYWTGTYWRIKGVMKPRVDFLFHSRNMETVDSNIHEASAGDHYPVFGSFVIP